MLLFFSVRLRKRRKYRGFRRVLDSVSGPFLKFLFGDHHTHRNHPHQHHHQHRHHAKNHPQQQHLQHFIVLIGTANIMAASSPTTSSSPKSSTTAAASSAFRRHHRHSKHMQTSWHTTTSATSSSHRHQTEAAGARRFCKFKTTKTVHTPSIPLHGSIKKENIRCKPHWHGRYHPPPHPPTHRPAARKQKGKTLHVSRIGVDAIIPPPSPPHPGTEASKKNTAWKPH